MELTPIHIPGKRRRKGEPPTVLAGPAKKGRRAKEEGEQTTTATAGKKKKREKRAPFKPRASYLEQEFPLEIVERIFWDSENVGLPRASPRLGVMLSGPSTRRETFIRAFGPTWDVWFGCARRIRDSHTVQSYHGWDTDGAHFGGQPEFQSALLEYSWVDVPFILACWDLWARRHAKDRYFQHVMLWGYSLASSSSPEQQQQQQQHGDCFGDTTTESGEAYFAHDYAAFCSLAVTHIVFNNVDSWIEVHPAARIPERLLTGPWDEPAQRKLFWLVRAGARLGPDQTWETTLEGYRNATCELEREPNMVVLRLLYLLGSFIDWPGYLVVDELNGIGERQRRCKDAGRLHEWHQELSTIAAMLRGSPDGWRTARLSQ